MMSYFFSANARNAAADMTREELRFSAGIWAAFDAAKAEGK